MNKRRLRFIGIIILIMTIFIPIFVFRIQDDYTFNKDVNWEVISKNQEVMKEHPIIASIYANHFSLLDEKSKKQYVIRSVGNYSKNEQEEIEKVKKLFTQEINNLLKNKIITHEALELEKNQDYNVDFGTIINNTTEGGGYYDLNQIFRFNTEQDNIIDFRIDKQTGKIIRISLESSLSVQLDEDELKEMSKSMIKYLGLDDIGDWKYTNYGYESYHAKLQVDCQVETLYNRQRLLIDVHPLGYTTPRFNITIG